MVAQETLFLKRLKRWSPRLFLTAGGLLFVYAALNGLWAFADMGTQESGFQVGYVLGFLGLLGLYPSLVPRSPRLARLGAAGAASGIVGITAITALELAQLGGMVSGTPPGWWLILLLALGGFLLGYLSFGTAILRTGYYPKSIGILVCIPGIIVVLMIIHITAGLASEVTAFVISAGEAMAHLAIGANLKTKSRETARETETGDAMAELPAND